MQKKVMMLNEMPKSGILKNGKVAVHKDFYWIKVGYNWVRDVKIGCEKFVS